MQNKNATIEHLKSHVTYPASKADLVKACSEAEFSDADKKEFSDSLPEGTYNSVGEVMKAMGW